jgi:predicted  nucleic acid-binding Zn-ribbon protein
MNFTCKNCGFYFNNNNLTIDYCPQCEEKKQHILKFVKEAEEFKKCQKYAEMPLDLRDFFNEELGRFKFALGAFDGKKYE